MSDFVVKPYVKFVPAEQDAVAEVAASAAEANTAAQGANTKIGNLTDLTTTAKTNLVAAINEANSHSVSPVQLPENADLTALTHEQFMQIWNNLLAGCSVILLGQIPITVIAIGDGNIAYFLNEEEPLALTNILPEEED